ncbi:MAG: caspase domain-containing protein [Hyphomicrobiaceae bacterium]
MLRRIQVVRKHCNVGAITARYGPVPRVFLDGVRDQRVALVIGNSAYAKVPRLINPSNYAAAVAALLKSAGFDRVITQENLGGRQLCRALRDFSDDAREADIAVVFYAGHGIEVRGINYLIPVDAVLERDIDVQDEAVALDRVNEVMDQGTHSASTRA